MVAEKVMRFQGKNKENEETNGQMAKKAVVVALIPISKMI
jgi:hypothetical protein